MKYSDWQLNRLRDALRAYKLYERSHEGEYFTWKDVREAIAADTGYEIGTSPENGAERLRQFVEGVNSKDGGRKYPEPKDDALDAIVQFALDEDNHLLSRDELNEYAPARQAPLRLLEYLDQFSGAERHIPVDKIEGVFQTRLKVTVRNPHFSVREITLQRPSPQGLVQVMETEDYYESEFVDSYDAATEEERKRKRDSQVRHGGWAVITPEDNLLFFMKNERNGRNRYYFTLATDMESWSDDPASGLVLLHHDFPLEIKTQKVHRDQLTGWVSLMSDRDILTFLRHESASNTERKDEQAI